MFFGGNFFFTLFFISFLNWWIPYFSYVFFLSLKYKNENCWSFIIASNFNGMNKLVEENFTQKKRVEFCPIFIWSLYSNPSRPVQKMCIGQAQFFKQNLQPCPPKPTTAKKKKRRIKMAYLILLKSIPSAFENACFYPFDNSLHYLKFPEMPQWGGGWFYFLFLIYFIVNATKINNLYLC